MCLEVHAVGNLSWMQRIRLSETEIMGIIYTANPYLNCKSTVSFWFLVYPDSPQL